MKLEGLNIVFFESRLADTMGELIALHGGKPVSAPALKEVPLGENPEAFAYGEKLFKHEIEVMIFLTGVGTRALLQVLETKYKKEDVVEAWRKLPIVARGPKPIRVLNELKVPVTIAVPEPNTWRELLDALDKNKDKVPVKGRVVAVQEYGVPNEELYKGLKERGADALRVPVYRWALPDHLEPLQKAIRETVDGKLHVAVFTTAVQIAHVMRLAKEMGLEEKLKKAFKKMAVASVGPDCTEALKSHGVAVDIQPHSPKMGPLVLEVAHSAKKVLDGKK
ncbi:MAG: uroporphyrinogen-III synthase [Candidatus Omnitrophota bacterium]